MIQSNCLSQKGVKDLDDFCSDVAPWAHSYSRVVISFVALKENNSWVLYAGRVSLGSMPVAEKHFLSETIRAGIFEVSENVSLSLEWLRTILIDGISYGDEQIRFIPPLNEPRQFHTHYTEYEGGPSVEARLSILRIYGNKFEEHENKDKLNLICMAADEPYSSFYELLNDFSVPDFGGQGGYLEVVGNVPCIVDRANSKLSSAQAEIVLSCLPDLDVSQLKIGIQIYDHKKIERISKTAADFQWGHTDHLKKGTFKANLSASALRLFVSYEGILLNHVWVGDPDRSLNVRRSIHSTFDPRLELLQSMLQKSPDSRQDSREFEAAIGWLFWILGFSVLAWSGSRRLTDAPDLVVQSDDGRVLVLEVTTGTLKTENKLANLLERTERVRAGLRNESILSSVTPIIVTSLPDEAIAVDLNAAQALGIGVISSQIISSLLGRTLVFPNSNVIASEFEAALINWRERHQ